MIKIKLLEIDIHAIAINSVIILHFPSLKPKKLKNNLFSNLRFQNTFVSRFENVRIEYYLTKPKTMLECKLLAMSVKDSEIVHSFDYKRYNHPLFREFFDFYLDAFH